MQRQKENYNITEERFKDYNANCITRAELMFKFIFYARKLARKKILITMLSVCTGDVLVPPFSSFF